MSAGPDRWMEVRRRIDDLEVRLRRGRFTVPTYLAATVFFLASGFFTDAWAPALVLGVLCFGAAWVTHRIRRTRTEQLRTLREMEGALPEDGEEEGDGPGR